MITGIEQPLDLSLGGFAPAGGLAQDALAIGARLLDHLTSLITSLFHLGSSIGGCARADVLSRRLRIDADLVGLLGGIAQNPSSSFLGADLDLRCALAGGLQDAQCLLIDQARRGGLIESVR